MPFAPVTGTGSGEKTSDKHGNAPFPSWQLRPDSAHAFVQSPVLMACIAIASRLEQGYDDNGSALRTTGIVAACPHLHISLSTDASPTSYSGKLGRCVARQSICVLLVRREPIAPVACACAGAIASRRGDPSVVVLCSPAVGCHFGVYQVVSGTGPWGVVCLHMSCPEDGFFRLATHLIDSVVIFIQRGIDCSSARRLQVLLIYL